MAGPTNVALLSLGEKFAQTAGSAGTAGVSMTLVGGSSYAALSVTVRVSILTHPSPGDWVTQPLYAVVQSSSPPSVYVAEAVGAIITTPSMTRTAARATEMYFFMSFLSWKSLSGPDRLVLLRTAITRPGWSGCGSPGRTEVPRRSSASTRAQTRADP